MSEVETVNPETGTDEALSFFRQALGAEKPTERAEKPEPKAAEQAHEAEPYDNDEQEHVEAPGDDPEPPEVEATDDAEPEPAEDQQFAVKVNGQEFKVSRDELIAGYQRDQDYRQKTQAVAAERQQVQSERQQYQQGLQILTAALQQSLPPPPDPRLRDEDPVEYMRAKEAHSEAVQRLHAVMGEQQRLAYQQQQQSEAQFQQTLEQARAELPKRIPTWRDPKKAEQEIPLVRSYLETSGFKREEIDTASDPRAIALAWKAMKYDQLVAKQNAAKPVAPKTIQPGPARTPSNDSAAVRSRNKLAKTGRPEDGFDYFKRLMGG